MPQNEFLKIRRGQGGIALLIAMVIIVMLSGLALSIVLLTASQIRLGQTVQGQGGAYYAAMAGLEEARGRMNGSAPDTIAASAPTTLQQVLYIVNPTSSDPVQPTNPASPYYDFEYAQEFSGGLGAATVLPYIQSDQPGATTSTSIPYKWVRITLKTTNGTSPLYWDGTQQTTSSSTGMLVYILTTLAVDPTKVRKMLQTEVAGTPGADYAPVAAVAGATSVAATGQAGPTNVTVNGNDGNPGTGGCPPATAALPGLLSGGEITVNAAAVTGNPPTQPNVAQFPQSVSTLVSQYFPASNLITSVDPAHVTVTGSTYTASGMTLGTQPAQEGSRGTAQIVYSNLPLTITGTGNSGYGVLLVNGNLTVTGAWNYEGVTIVNGAVNFAPASPVNIQIRGALLASGSISLNSAPSPSGATITALYDSCVVNQAMQGLNGGAYGLASTTTSPQILSYRELSF